MEKIFDFLLLTFFFVLLYSAIVMKFTFNLASLAILPNSVFLAKTAEEQIDAIYMVADDPNTPYDRAEKLAKLAGKLMKKIN